MRIGILQPSYLPWIGVFNQLKRVDTFVFYDDVQYTKNDWRNRNRVKTPQGECWLTIPVEKKRQPLNNVLILDRQWPSKHLKTLEMNYKRAPYFEEVYKILENNLTAGWIHLSPLCTRLIRDFAHYMGIDVKFRWSSDIGFRSLRKTNRLIKICEYLGATEYLATSACRNYMDESLFKIPVEYQDYEHPEYTQQWDGFLPYMSIVDLLFNHGRSSVEII